jgi:hypothetical protein
MAKNTNNITGDKIITKGMLTKQGEANFDLIFGKKKIKEHPEDDGPWDEARVDIIGQNGPTGLHYKGESNE